MNRRDALQAVGALALLPTTARATSQATLARTAHRTYEGRIDYLSDNDGEVGREWFCGTVQPDGTRTLRARVEMDDGKLLRDVVLTADADYRPIDGFVRVAVAGKTVGATWYTFSEQLAACEGMTSGEGRISQQMATEERIRLFWAHPISSDAWLWGAVRGTPDLNPHPWFNTSLARNGASGPTLVRMTPGVLRVGHAGKARVAVRAGSFDCERVQLLGRPAPGADKGVVLNDAAILGEDCVAVRMRFDQSRMTYELVELSGDYR